MTHAELVATATLKFCSYNIAQCDFALSDIHATLAAQGNAIEKSYEDKLYAELDAARERKRQLNTVRSRSRATELLSEAIEAIGWLLDHHPGDPLLESRRARARAIMESGKVCLGQ